MTGERIRGKLQQIEEDNPIRIVDARLLGSRAMGVDHDRSDYDIRFIFAQDPMEYVKLSGDYIGTLDRPGEQIDLHGWNVDKFADLALDSDPNIVEYCRHTGRNCYVQRHGEAFDYVAEEVVNNANHMSLYNHYMSLAKRNHSKYVDDGAGPANRQFHVLRGVACAQYLRRACEVPPLYVPSLIGSGYLNANVASTLDKLAGIKSSGNGSRELADQVGKFYQTESSYDIEPIDRRIRSPDRRSFDVLLTETIK